MEVDMDQRTCDRCGGRSSPHIPRTRLPDGRLVCEGCAHATARERKEPVVATRKTAHDSGDGATIFHCPFCGSGQVIARSDRTTECEYCHACFTVQVQPQFPAFPQTIDGMPMQVPGMPGQIGGPPGVPPTDPMAGGMPPGQDPTGGMDDGTMPPEGDPEAGGAPDEEDDEDGGAPPFAKGSMLRTASGTHLNWDNYLRHLAIRHADDKDAVLNRIREGRR
jgi:ribosomal protein L37AE/L43A